MTEFRGKKRIISKHDVSEGHHSIVISYPEVGIVLKIFREDLKQNATREFNYLSSLYGKGYPVPKPYAIFFAKYPVLVREYIAGIHFNEFLDKATLLQIKEVIMRLLSVLHGLDKEKLFIDELSFPTRNIIVDNKLNVYLIDLERISVSERRCNVTQFLGFIYRTKFMETELREKIDMIIDVEKVMEVSKQYKKTKDLNLILQIFKEI